jgi:hypothetical protein
MRGGANCDLFFGPDRCDLSLFSNAVLYATFTAASSPGGPPPRPSTYPLTVKNVNEGYNGNGTVTSNPAGINCGPTCTSSFAPGSSVTLTATPSSVSVFSGWKGCDSSMGTTCTVAMSGARNVEAGFGYP